MDQLFNMIAHSPALSALDLESTGESHVIESRIHAQMGAAVPWLTLTISIELRYWTPAMVAQLLGRYCPNLEFLASRLPFPEDNPDPPAMPEGHFQHDKMKALYLKDQWGFDILKKLTLPALTELQVNMWGAPVLGAEHKTVCREGIANTPADPPEHPPCRMSHLVVRILQAAHSVCLTSLTIYIQDFPDGYFTFLDAITLSTDGPDGTSSPIFPNLRSLDMTIDFWHERDESWLVRMLSSRFAATERFETAVLILYLDTDAEDHLFQELETHCQGVEVFESYEVNHAIVVQRIFSALT